LSDFMLWINNVPTVLGILFAALLATVGWLYAARRQRVLSRKQHTFNALLQASFNKDFQEAQNAVRPHTRSGALPDLNEANNQKLKEQVGFLLNHYEFLAAGIRNGDIAEELLKDSERGTILRLYETAQPFIGAVRDNRKRRATFEHIEWLYDRWHAMPPPWWHSVAEMLRARPFYHAKNAAWAYGGCAIALLAAWAAWSHLPNGYFETPDQAQPGSAARGNRACSRYFRLRGLASVAGGWPAASPLASPVASRPGRLHPARGPWRASGWEPRPSGRIAGC
jgi:hypothetical protein